MSTFTYYRDTVEYVKASCTADATLDTQTVEMSFDEVTWFAAEWVGAAATTRTCRALVGSTVPWPAATTAVVYVRVTDNPEIPVKRAGRINIV